MENATNDVDFAKNKIDQELFILYSDSKNGSDYQFFDFHEAIRFLIECILKEGKISGRQEYFYYLMSQYHKVFSDLFSGVYETKSSDFLGYNRVKRIAQYVDRSILGDGLIIETKKEFYIEEDHDHNWYVNNEQSLKIKTFDYPPRNKYSYLLRNCIIQNMPLGWKDRFEKSLNKLFQNYNSDPEIRMTFEEYVEIVERNKIFKERPEFNSVKKVGRKKNSMIYDQLMSRIQNQALKMPELFSRLQFLYYEKGSFISMNRGTVADMVVKWFDNFIDMTKLELERQNIMATSLKSVDTWENIDQQKSESEKLKNGMLNNGFLDLATVKCLNEKNQNKLIELICENQMPYCIAMFSYLGFIQFLGKKFDSKYALYKAMSKWFNSDEEGRTVKGNLNILNESSKEDPNRYTSSKFIKKVQEDYEKIVKGV